MRRLGLERCARGKGGPGFGSARAASSVRRRRGGRGEEGAGRVRAFRPALDESPARALPKDANGATGTAKLGAVAARKAPQGCQALRMRRPNEGRGGIGRRARRAGPGSTSRRPGCELMPGGIGRSGSRSTWARGKGGPGFGSARARHRAFDGAAAAGARKAPEGFERSGSRSTWAGRGGCQAPGGLDENQALGCAGAGRTRAGRDRALRVRLDVGARQGRSRIRLGPHAALNVRRRCGGIDARRSPPYTRAVPRVAPASRV